MSSSRALGVFLCSIAVLSSQPALGAKDRNLTPLEEAALAECDSALAPTSHNASLSAIPLLDSIRNSVHDLISEMNDEPDALFEDSDEFTPELAMKSMMVRSHLLAKTGAGQSRALVLLLESAIARVKTHGLELRQDSTGAAFLGVEVPLPSGPQRKEILTGTFRTNETSLWIKILREEDHDNTALASELALRKLQSLYEEVLGEHLFLEKVSEELSEMRKIRTLEQEGKRFDKLLSIVEKHPVESYRDKSAKIEQLEGLKEIRNGLTKLEISAYGVDAREGFEATLGAALELEAYGARSNRELKERLYRLEGPSKENKIRDIKHGIRAATDALTLARYVLVQLDLLTVERNPDYIFCIADAIREVTKDRPFPNSFEYRELTYKRLNQEFLDAFMTSWRVLRPETPFPLGHVQRLIFALQSKRTHLDGASAIHHAQYIGPIVLMDFDNQGGQLLVGVPPAVRGPLGHEKPVVILRKDDGISIHGEPMRIVRIFAEKETEPKITVERIGREGTLVTAKLTQHELVRIRPDPHASLMLDHVRKTQQRPEKKVFN